MKTIKRLTLALICAVTTLGASAQVMEKFPGLQLVRISENGRWLVGGGSGITVLDRESGLTYDHSSNYVLGMGDCISNDGILVGAYDGYTVPGICIDGKWSSLPHNAGSTTYARAEAITPDSRFIIGVMDCRNVTRQQWPMVQPVIWERQANGSYKFSILPCPQKDVCNTSPQQVTVSAISADGKHMVGQIVDYRGLIEYQIKYNRADDGAWSFAPLGENLVVKEGSVWPPLPERPVQPKPENYLTDDEKIAFNEANQAYLDSLEIVSLTGKNPRMPWYQDFVKERKDEYEADLKAYKQAAQEYDAAVKAFNQAYFDNLTNNKFEFNSAKMSANGDYIAANFIYSGPSGADGTSPTYVSPLMHLADGSHELFEHQSMSLFTVCNDGAMVASTPTRDDYVYSRTSWIKPLDQKPVLFVDWLKTRCRAAYDWLEENMTYTVPASETKSTVAETQIFSGTVRMTPAADMAIAYAVNPETGVYDSYILDFDAQPASLSSVSEEAPYSAYCTGGILHITGDPAAVQICDITGRLLMPVGGCTGQISLSAYRGSVVVVSLSGDHGTKTMKLVVK